MPITSLCQARANKKYREENREKYNEIIKLATKGETKYVFPLTDYLKCLNNRVNFNNLLY